jgi:hypothetical protein
VPEPFGFVPLSRSLPFWPGDLLGQPELLEEIGVRDFHIQEDVNLLRMSGTLLWFREIAFELPLLSGFSVALLNENGHTAVPFEIDVRPEFAIRFPSLRMSLRLQTEFLRSVRQERGRWIPVHDVHGNPRPPELRFDGVGVGFDLHGNIEILMPAGAPQIGFGPVKIGDTGIVLEIDGVAPYFSDRQTPPLGAAPGFRGVAIGAVTLHLPEDWNVPIVPENLTFEHLLIGTGGFSGTIRGTWNPVYRASSHDYSGNGSGTLFGIPFALRSLELSFLQNIPSASSFHCEMVLPFFDLPVGVEISIGSDGALAVSLSAVQPPGITHHQGLVTLEKEGLLSLTLDSIGFEVQEGIFKVKLSGAITPKFGEPDLVWPTIRVNELSIDSEGHVHLDGGWLDLPDQYALDFHAFKIQITRLGFGNSEDGGHWIGFSGGLRLVDGLQAGASVDGLKLTWYDHVDGEPDRQPKLTLNGVAVDFVIEDTLRFAGAVAYHELQVPGSLEVEHRFDGRLTLDLLALDFEIDSRIVIGSHDGPSGSYQYLAIYADAELPFGIPLASTGLALYGFAGLFALNMEPDKGPAQPWYSTATEDRTGGDWFHYREPGVAVLTKWRNQLDSLALGAGVTIGTLTDNGYIFSGKFLLVFIFPGPIIMLEGKANLLKERAQLASGDPLFRALTVLDFRVGIMLMGLDVHYKYKANGQLLDLHGGSEAFFDFHDGSIWHIYLGEREPRTRRIRADLFNRLIQANAYFMIDAQHFATGAWAGLDQSWNYGPLSLTIQVWIEFNAQLSYKPTQFHGELGMHGGLALRLFGFGFEVALDARLTADTPHPYHILGNFDVALNMPMPLPSYSASVSLEWGPVPDRPPIPLLLKEVTVEHFKTTTCWPLPRQGAERLLVPDYDDGAGFLREFGVVPYDETTAPPDYAPVVPLDSRPRLTFGCSVNDEAGIGVNAHLADPEWERIGDPARNEGPMRARYALKQVVLDRWDPQSTSWRTEAYRGGPTPPSATESQVLFGSWAPTPQIPSESGDGMGHTKLWLWSQNPFDYTRRTGGAYEEWFASRYPDYPCLPPLKEHVVCVDFEESQPGPLPENWEHPDVPGLIFRRGDQTQQKGTTVITELDTPLEDFRRALCLTATPQSRHIQVELPRNTRAVTFLIRSRAEHFFAIGVERDKSAIRGDLDPDMQRVRISGSELIGVLFISGTSSVCISQICLTISPDPNRVAEREAMTLHLREEVTRWQQVGTVLRPHSQYRLKVVTSAEVKGAGELSSYENSFTQSEYAFFRTEGPPALANLSLPVGIQDALLDEATLLDHESALIGIDGSVSTRRVLKSELNDLTRYVRQTNPPTVPAPGEPPVLTRPVYRAYDVSVEFNENYVDLLYRMERRDLGLYLFDQNNRPVRDVEDRIVSLDSWWGRSLARELARSDRRWEALLRNNNCQLGLVERPHDSTLFNTTKEALEPESLYEARLIPLLLHDDFAGYGNAAISGPTGVLGGWHIHDVANDEGPSRWEIGSEGSSTNLFLTQTSRLWDGKTDSIVPVRYETLLVFQDTAQTSPWTDYRFRLYLRRGAGEIVGIVFRFRDDNNHYRWTLDNSYMHQLVRVVDGAQEILTKEKAVVNDEQDVLLTIEAVRDHLRGYLDGRPLFDLTDATFSSGTIGLYCRNNPHARFAEVWVEDFRPAAPVAYRFQFVTSRFTNFFHHLHSYQDETWRASVAGVEGTAPALRKAVSPSTPVTDNEVRAYEALATAVLGPAAKQNPPEVQVTRVDIDGAPMAFLMQSPEPIDWLRTEIALSGTSLARTEPALPSKLKLAAVNFAANMIDIDSVVLLLREPMDLSGYLIESRLVTWPVNLESGVVIDAQTISGDELSQQAWTTYREFGAERNLAAGKILFASAEPSASGHLTGLDAGKVDFARRISYSVELRLVASDGEIVHARHFLPDDNYPNEDVNVLRKADGTGFFMVKLDGGSSVIPFPLAQYRLKLTYHRNNRTRVAASQILSQAGNDADELVTLDIPLQTQ